VKKCIWEALELPTDPKQVAAWQACNTCTQADKKHQSSLLYKANALEQAKKKRKVVAEEIQASAKCGDDYLGPAHKTALVHKQVCKCC